MSKMIMIGVALIALFFLSFIIRGFPFIGSFATPVSQTGILLPAGLGLVFLGNPSVMFIVIIGATLFLFASGVSLVP